VSLNVAVAVINTALEEGLTTKIQKDSITSETWVRDFVARKMYFPTYVPLL
jgi:malic enzyme